MYQFRGEREGVRTLAGLSGGVAAVGTSRLLDVKRAAACSIQKKKKSQPILHPYYLPPLLATSFRVVVREHPRIRWAQNRPGRLE